MDPKELRDAYITDVFQESPTRLLLHLKDGRAVALTASLSVENQIPLANLRCEVVNR